MRKKLSLLITIPLLLFAFYYLLSPLSGFPSPPSGSLVSIEPADTESIYRTAFYTQLSRTEVMNYFQKKFGQSLRINRPPEESSTFIRELTPSSWLEELVHPWKDSLYINGFYPTKPTEKINISNQNYQAKITLHYFPSSVPTRLTVLVLCTFCSYILFREYAKV